MIDEERDVHHLVERSWRAYAICAEVDPELWFPEPGTTSFSPRSICEGCPVRAECLVESVIWRMEYGVWGGIGATYRRDIGAAFRGIEDRAQMLDVAEKVIAEHDSVNGADQVFESRREASQAARERRNARSRELRAARRAQSCVA